MTETRKQIIELIEPYMDKNLCEGCLIEIEWWEILQLDELDEVELQIQGDEHLAEIVNQERDKSVINEQVLREIELNEIEASFILGED